MYPVGWTPVVFRRRAVSGQDEYGNDTYTVTETVVEGCSVQPRTSSESADGRAQVITGLWVYAPAGADIDAHDEAEVGGVRYQVDGEPGIFSQVSGHPVLQQVALRRVSG